MTQYYAIDTIQYYTYTTQYYKNAILYNTIQKTTKSHLETTDWPRKMIGYKINANKSIVFLHANNEIEEREIIFKNLFTM